MDGKLIKNGYVRIKNKVCENRSYWKCAKTCHKKKSRDVSESFFNAEVIKNRINGSHNVYENPFIV